MHDVFLRCSIVVMGLSPRILIEVYWPSVEICQWESYCSLLYLNILLMVLKKPWNHGVPQNSLGHFVQVWTIWWGNLAGHVNEFFCTMCLYFSTYSYIQHLAKFLISIRPKKSGVCLFNLDLLVLHIATLSSVSGKPFYIQIVWKDCWILIKFPNFYAWSLKI